MNNTREFSGSQNVWIKRLGFFILVLGMFPNIIITYGDEVEIIAKVIITSIVASYTIYHIKGFFRSIFKSEK